MNKEFASLPDEFSYPNEYEVRQNKELNIVPTEFPKVKEFEFDQEFNSDVVENDDTGTTTSLQDQYSKILKILKLATTVSLAATTTSAALPKIVPIINIDATEESSTKTAETTTQNSFIEEASGEWSISDIKKYIIVDGEEVEDTSTIDTTNIISYSIESDSDGLYLNTYENGELSNTTLLIKDEDGNYVCHIIRQNEDEVDITVYLEDESLVIKETGTTTVGDETYDTATYYYCTKGSSTYYVDNAPKEETQTVIEEVCPTCNGEGTLTCETCSGSGLIECSECKGTGYLDVDCTTCLGAGDCVTCNGSGIIQTTTINEETGLEEVVEEKCTECDGTGICVTCNGSGKEKCPTCNSEGTNENPGYLKCETCLGEGKVTCTECDGTGKIEISEETTTEEEIVPTEEETSNETESTNENLENTNNETTE